MVVLLVKCKAVVDGGCADGLLDLRHERRKGFAQKRGPLAKRYDLFGAVLVGHYLVDTLMVYMKLVHAQFIFNPQVDEQRAGQAGGEAYEVDEKGAPKSLYVPIEHQQVMA